MIITLSEIPWSVSFAAGGMDAVPGKATALCSFFPRFIP
jgi:hypothetical protein